MSCSSVLPTGATIINYALRTLAVGQTEIKNKTKKQLGPCEDVVLKVFCEVNCWHARKWKTFKG